MQVRAAALVVVQMDVFASRPLEGNQLAVFTDARDLSDEEILARLLELNLARTQT